MVGRDYPASAAATCTPPTPTHPHTSPATMVHERTVRAIPSHHPYPGPYVHTGCRLPLSPTIPCHLLPSSAIPMPSPILICTHRSTLPHIIPSSLPFLFFVLACSLAHFWDRVAWRWYDGRRRRRSWRYVPSAGAACPHPHTHDQSSTPRAEQTFMLVSRYHTLGRHWGYPRVDNVPDAGANGLWVHVFICSTFRELCIRTLARSLAKHG